MPQTRKQETRTGKAGEKDRSKPEVREDAQASRQDRPGTSLPAQRERWEDEGGAPAGVLSSTDAVEPKESSED